MDQTPNHYPTVGAKCADLVVHIVGLAFALFAGGTLLGLSVVCSGPLMQGKILSRPLPERLRRPTPGLSRDSQRALQFSRSAPGVIAVLCGMKDPAHVAENLKLLSVPPLSEDAFAQGYCSGG